MISLGLLKSSQNPRLHLFYSLKTRIVFLILFAIVYGFPNNSTCQPAHSNKHLIIEDILIEGNSKTKKDVIFDLLTIETGDTITPALLTENNDKLSQTKFFKNVDIYTRPGSIKGNLIVIIEIIERIWPYYRFEGGKSELEGWYIVPLSFRFDNFFGHGNLMSWQITIGDRISRNSINYQNPHLLHSKATLSASLYGENQNFVHYFGEQDTTENVESIGLKFTLKGNEGFSRYLFSSFRVAKYKPSRNDTLETFFPDDFNKAQINSFTAGLRADFRDNETFPLNGFWGLFSVEFANKILGSDINFPKINIDTRFYKKISNFNVYALHIKGNITSSDAPFYERFYLGGSYSLRGFRYGFLTPRGWGTKLLLIQNEFRIPLSTKKFPYHKHTAVFFIDSGGIWAPDQNHSFE